ncbi:hypothetical protein [Dechloromonas denitrificans]|uniref:hypothetical protein n=1 Tax=Dechloromonas denitrificans TaxID=281362 RepID=UPI001CF87509|nr:hypothetical protein [Dechloromonas denitrificans]
MARRARHLGGLIAVCIAATAQAQSVVCHLSYGGETQVVEARPSTDPYSVAPVAVGSYFLFRIVFRQEPADLAGIKLYAYADRDAGPVLIHQASYRYPLAAALPDYGFSGLHFVYEPVRDGELQYWCELKDAAAK